MFGRDNKLPFISLKAESTKVKSTGEMGQMTRKIPLSKAILDENKVSAVPSSLLSAKIRAMCDNEKPNIILVKDEMSGIAYNSITFSNVVVSQRFGKVFFGGRQFDIETAMVEIYEMASK